MRLRMIKNKKGSSMLDYFILTMVSLFIGSAVILISAEIKKGILLGKNKVSAINESLEGDSSKGGKGA